MVPRGRYLPEKEQTSRAEVDKERGEGKVLPKYLLCFKFCASPFHIYYFTYTKKIIIIILQSTIFILLKKKLGFNKFNYYVPSYQRLCDRAEDKAQIYLIPKLFPHGMLPLVCSLSLSFYIINYFAGRWKQSSLSLI